MTLPTLRQGQAFINAPQFTQHVPNTHTFTHPLFEGWPSGLPTQDKQLRDSVTKFCAGEHVQPGQTLTSRSMDGAFPNSEITENKFNEKLLKKILAKPFKARALNIASDKKTLMRGMRHIRKNIEKDTGHSVVMVTNNHTRSYFDGFKGSNKIWGVGTTLSLNNNIVYFVELTKNSDLYYELIGGVINLTDFNDFDSVVAVTEVINIIQ